MVITITADSAELYGSSLRPRLILPHCLPRQPTRLPSPRARQWRQRSVFRRFARRLGARRARFSGIPHVPVRAGRVVIVRSPISACTIVGPAELRLVCDQIGCACGPGDYAQSERVARTLSLLIRQRTAWLSAGYSECSGVARTFQIATCINPCRPRARHTAAGSIRFAGAFGCCRAY